MLMGEGIKTSHSFSIGETAPDKLGFKSVITNVPIINLDGMHNPSQRTLLVEQIGNACRHKGFFQVINHGIPLSLLEGALSAANGFFDLPIQEKAKFMSADVHNPVRYCASLREDGNEVKSWRHFLKQYAHPLSKWIRLWPHSPPDYRFAILAMPTVHLGENGRICSCRNKLGVDIIAAMTESLGLSSTHLSTKLEAGTQIMVVNSYPPHPTPLPSLGMPPHTDYSCITIVLQQSSGLQFLDSQDNTWKEIPKIDAALHVHIGDQLEVLSNGRYKSVVHRVTVAGAAKTRISIASLHGLGMDEKVEVAEELAGEEQQHPKGYRESSLRDFLDFIARNEIWKGKSFLDTLKSGSWTG